MGSSSSCSSPALESLAFSGCYACVVEWGVGNTLQQTLRRGHVKLHRIQGHRGVVAAASAAAAAATATAAATAASTATQPPADLACPPRHPPHELQPLQHRRCARPLP